MPRNPTSAVGSEPHHAVEHPETGPQDRDDEGRGGRSRTPVVGATGVLTSIRFDGDGRVAS